MLFKDPRHSCALVNEGPCGYPSLLENRSGVPPTRQARGWNHGPVYSLSSVFAPCAHNVMHALLKRHLAVQRVISSDACFDWFYDSCNRAGGWFELYYSDCAPMRFGSVNDWIGQWPTAKQSMFQASYDRLHRYKPNVVRLFVKAEIMTMLWLFTGVVYSVKPRIIQAYPNYVTQAMFSWEIANLQARLFHFRRVSLGENIEITIACGMTPKDIGEWCDAAEADLPGAGVLEQDATSWDAMQQLFHFQLKMRIYKRLGLSQGALDFIARGFRVTGVSITSAGGTVTTDTDGTVKSGHADTTLGNSIINAAIAATAAHTLGCAARIIVAGDDLLMFVKHPLLSGRELGHSLAAIAAGYGIIPKAAIHDSVCHASFISLAFFRSRFGNIVASPKPGRQLAKLFWSVKRIAEDKRNGYVRAVCQGMLRICPGMPVLSPWLRAVEAAHNGGADFMAKTGHYVIDQPFMGNYNYVEDDVYDAFCQRYGFTDSDVRELTSYVCRHTFGGVHRHCLVERMKDVDLVDYGGAATCY